MNILVACEESQRVCVELRKRGHSAYSCDIMYCSGGHPEWHIQRDVSELLNGYIQFQTCDNVWHDDVLVDNWDMIIAFPPCTYLTHAGNRWFDQDVYGENAIEREEKSKLAQQFFMNIIEADCDKIAVENPIGRMSKIYRKPDQIIEPWMFGHGETKATCLWLKGLPKLESTNIVEGREQNIIKMGGYADTSIRRSKTYAGVAKAMAEQWTPLVENVKIEKLDNSINFFDIAKILKGE